MLPMWLVRHTPIRLLICSGKWSSRAHLLITGMIQVDLSLSRHWHHPREENSLLVTYTILFHRRYKQNPVNQQKDKQIFEIRVYTV